jgi:hypothetical protein
MKLQSWLIRAMVVAALVVTPIAAAAQAGVASADAAAFLGSWTVTLDSPQGAFEQTIDIKDASGKVAATLTSPVAPGPTEITDISKTGNDLVLKFAGDFQGQAFTAAITLTPDGDKSAKVSMNIMDGMFVMDGKGVKK